MAICQASKNGVEDRPRAPLQEDAPLTQVRDFQGLCQHMVRTGMYARAHTHTYTPLLSPRGETQAIGSEFDLEEQACVPTSMSQPAGIASRAELWRQISPWAQPSPATRVSKSSG